MTTNGWHRRNNNSPAAKARKRQYNSREHRQRRTAGQHQVDAGKAHCWRCGQHIPPGTTWHLGHDDYDRTIYRGTECVRCNLTAAARKGNHITNRRTHHTNSGTTRHTTWHSQTWT